MMRAVSLASGRLTVRMSASTKALSKSAPPKTRTRFSTVLDGMPWHLERSISEKYFQAALLIFVQGRGRSASGSSLAAFTLWG